MSENKTSQVVEQMAKGDMAILMGRPTRVGIAAKYQGDQLSMANAIAQLRQILPLMDALQKDHWPSSPPTRIEAVIGTLEEALDFDPLNAD